VKKKGKPLRFERLDVNIGEKSFTQKIPKE
jgi:hypothetical protein